MGQEVISLQELVENIKQKDSNDLKDDFKEFIESYFTCPKNEDVIKYLKEKAIDDEKHHKSRTYFVYNDTKLVGFFTITIKVLDISKLEKKEKKKLLYKGKGPNNINYIPVYLIGQIAKNDKYKNEITGKELLLIVLDKIKEVNKVIGVKIIMLDSVSKKNGRGKIVVFYKQNGFKEYSKVIKDIHKKEKTIVKYLLPMFTTLEDIKL